jgi:hypothetical protein
MFAVLLFSGLSYLTLVTAPFLNLTLRKLSLLACLLLLGKYLSELLTFSGLLVGLFSLLATILDIVGTALFYVTAVRGIQLIC